MSDLFNKMKEAFDKVRSEDNSFGLYGTRYVPTKNSQDDENPDAAQDFPYIQDPKGFPTNIPLEQDELREQTDDEKEPAINPAAAAQAPAEQPITPEGETAEFGGMDQGAGGDFGALGGAEGGIGGVPGQEPLTANQIGRVYELKKIYSRLSSVETFLSRTTDETILEVRKLVSQAIDLFELVISNYDQYKDQVDDIIVTYYEFLNTVYDTIKKYFSTKTKE